MPMLDQTPAAHVTPSGWHHGPVLLADDDDELRSVIAEVLRSDGYEVIEARNGEELWALLLSELEDGPVHRPGVVICDIRMPGASGLEILRALRACNKSMPVVLTTAFGDEATHAEAESLGAELLLDKPFDLAELRVVVRILLGP